jgi:hypothetical protein
VGHAARMGGHIMRLGKGWEIHKGREPLGRQTYVKNGVFWDVASYSQRS